MSVIPFSNEDKARWCEMGEKAERAMMGPLLTSGAMIFPNPAKVKDKYAHDCYLALPSDVKTVTTRFNTADRYGIDPRTAITLNVKDVSNYVKHTPDIVIVFNIDFGDFKSMRYTDLRELRRAVDSGMAKLHTYQNRVNDTAGNARDSYVLDALWFRELREVCRA